MASSTRECDSYHGCCDVMRDPWFNLPIAHLNCISYNQGAPASVPAPQSLPPRGIIPGVPDWILILGAFGLIGVAILKSK